MKTAEIYYEGKFVTHVEFNEFQDVEGEIQFFTGNKQSELKLTALFCKGYSFVIVNQNAV